MDSLTISLSIFFFSSTHFFQIFKFYVELFTIFLKVPAYDVRPPYPPPSPHHVQDGTFDCFSRNFPLIVQEFVRDEDHPALLLALKMHELQGDDIFRL
jgi:hypothetical protein